MPSVQEQSTREKSSPFSHLFGGNSALSEEDHSNVRRHLTRAKAEISSLDAEIAELQRRVESLQSKRSVLQDDVDLHQPLISAIRRLPFDILEQIFYYCLPTTRNAAMSTLDAPLKFSRVCSSWRSAVYAAPRLWQTLHIAIPSFPYRSFDNITFGSHGFPAHKLVDSQRQSEIDIAVRRMGGAMQWLRRSHPYPISISIALRSHDNVVPEVLNVIFTTMFGFCDRWANIDFDLPFSQRAFHMLSSVTKEKLIHLRTLRLKWSHTPLPSSIAHPEWFKTQLMLAPNLEHFQMIGFADGFRLGVAWSQLTELTIEDCALPSDEARNILAKCPKLRLCRLHISRTPAPVQPIDPRIIFMNELESFALIERGAFPARIRAPKLRRLIYEACRDYNVGPTQHFDVFELTLQGDLPTRLPCYNLEAVTFDPTTTRQDLILDFISYAPNLRELRLESPKSQITTPERTWMTTHEFKIGDHFVKALTPVISSDVENGSIESAAASSSTQSRSLCPKLVHFECTSRTGFSDKVLYEFIRNRLQLSTTPEGQDQPPSYSALQKVVVEFERVKELEICEDLRVAGLYSSTTGMELCLTYHSRKEGYTSPEVMSPWNGLRSREMIPNNVDWVFDEHDLYA
ncbi:hypothetical protein CVT24_004993 [Panaeolus cyanescens]|uniref:Uncharacterized protein n=1 Tax=Panaeolus cyanescens TaxID=181874 RepID=A0A409V9N7_9AGAR|nr:hypothetical protein CVT24_004993 [Panaeolus cyanescens]